MPQILWERACSRWRRHSRHGCRQAHRYREQARSHRGFVVDVRAGVGTRSPVRPCTPVYGNRHTR
ncbi:hypothetical protein FGE05_20605 [Pseudomonas sp. ICMP22404]|nr:hypothetical protein FGE05_20605 [Pseudomonas sp. ICMP22404]